MILKIEKSFQNSRFYRNYNNIDNVILKFEKIKNGFIESKNKYKNEMIRIINLLDKNNIQKFNIILSDKIELNILENELNSCKKILIEKINTSHNIKKYIKYSENINEDFIKSVKTCNIKNINLLIINGANIHYKNDFALRWSSCYGNIDIVKFLVEKGANIHAKNDNALKWSSFHGHIEVVKFLVGKGANIHANIDEALKYSSLNGHIDVVKFLVEKGANIHADDDSPFRSSIYNRHIDVVKFLVEKGANIHVMNERALIVSSGYFHIEVVKFLINSDLEYYCNKELARNIVIKHNLIEFYEKFNIK